MSEIESRFVKRGVWTNLDQGPVMGRTITTDTTTGNLIVALLAISSTLGTAHLFNLLSFAIHQLRANGRPADALFRQQQALLRTLPTPGTVMVDALKLWWAWKRKARRSFLRSILLVLVALTFSASTTAASIFSSLVVDSSNLIVLVSSNNCGWTNRTSVFSAGSADSGPVLAVAAPYAKQCYPNAVAPNQTLPAVCNSVFVRPNINFTTERVPCPFAEGFCENGDAVSLDSGLVDVSKMFGLNLPSTSGVKLRKKTTCAVLPLKNHTAVMKMADYPGTPSRPVLPDEKIALVNYGAKVGDPGNATFVMSLIQSNLTNTIDILPSLIHYNSKFSQAVSSFTPIPELVHSNSSLVLKFLSFNSAKFQIPEKDALYHTNQSVQALISYNGVTFDNYTRYMADFPIKGMGCLEQYQFCYTRTSGEDFCTDLGDIPDSDGSSASPVSTDIHVRDIPASDSPTSFPDPNEVQYLILKKLIAASLQYGISSAVDLKISTLQSTGGLLKGFYENPGKDYWIQEVQEWEKQVWVAFQVLISDVTIGMIDRPVFIGDNKYRVIPDGVKTLCGAQKMRVSGNVVNVNVFAFAFIIAFSLLVSIIDITLLKFLVFLSRFRHGLAPRIERWVQDGVWQLQRRAYEGQGHRGWIDVEKDIPLTTDHKLLVDLPIMWTPDKPVHGNSVADSRSSIGSARTYRTGRSPHVVEWI